MIDFKLADLRKKKGITQKELGDVLGVSYQTVSKWENGIVLPDIETVANLSEYFEVSADALLGLVPLSEEYQPSNSGTKEYWAGRLEYLKRTRKTMWNEDYIWFLIENVWKIRKPVTILDCGCGYGALGLLLLPMLPEGSKYVGIDFSEVMLEEAEKIYEEAGYEGKFILTDIMDYSPVKKYDVVISQAVLRHVDNGEQFLQKMVTFMKPGGLFISLECNREFEEVGLYIDGMDYAYLCEHEGLKKLWAKELAMQNRDYSIAMKLPHYMKKVGLVDVECRMNDRITYLEPNQNGYKQNLAEIAAAHWTNGKSAEEVEQDIAYYMNHGMSRVEAERYCRRENMIVQHLRKHAGDVALTKMDGIVISYGWKR